MTPFIETKDLCFTYMDNDGTSQTPALRGVSLTIQKGEYVAVLGHNGSGKSTFAKLLNLLLEPTSGTLIINGINYTDHSLTDDEVLSLRKNVGMIFQNPDNQLVASIVEEDVAFGPENLGIKNPELSERVHNALESVGMLDFAEREPHRMSGGQKQRIAIAGVIAMKPDCIIFDESTAMLDPSGRREVLDTMKKLNKEENITIINITHFMDEAAEADHVFVINDGLLLMDGTPDEVFARKKELLDVGLAVPQCAEVAHQLIEDKYIPNTNIFAHWQEVADVILKVFKEDCHG